jgi:hypothetical protein
VFEITGFISGVGLTPLDGYVESSNELMDSGGQFLDRLSES